MIIPAIVVAVLGTRALFLSRVDARVWSVLLNALLVLTLPSSTAAIWHSGRLATGLVVSTLLATPFDGFAPTVTAGLGGALHELGFVDYRRRGPVLVLGRRGPARGMRATGLHIPIRAARRPLGHDLFADRVRRESPRCDASCELLPTHLVADDLIQRRVQVVFGREPEETSKFADVGDPPSKILEPAEHRDIRVQVEALERTHGRPAPRPRATRGRPHGVPERRAPGSRRC